MGGLLRFCDAAKRDASNLPVLAGVDAGEQQKQDPGRRSWLGEVISDVLHGDAGSWWWLHNISEMKRRQTLVWLVVDPGGSFHARTGE